MPAQAQLTQIATFDHQVTGVSVAEDGRTFVNFPRWTEDAPVSVAELKPDGTVVPYPDAEWNSWRNAKKNQVSAGDHFVCVQSVVAAGRGSLWVLDPAAPATATLVPGGPKLVQVDLASDRVTRTIAFDTSVAPNGSYLNDVRFSPDGRAGYITDSGGQGALVVVDLESGHARRVLDAHPSVQAEKTVVVTIDGQEIRRPDGRGVEFASDGIALSPDGRYLYWKAVTAHSLYRVPTEALLDAGLADDQLARRVELVGQTVVSDGLWFDPSGRLYLTAPELHAVVAREADGTETTVVQDDRLDWPDTMSQGPDGTLYVTASHIPDMAWYTPDQSPQLRGTALFRLDAPR